MAEVTLLDCSHGKVMPGDPGDASFFEMTVDEVQEFYPRFSGVCPDCGWSGILYASYAHYIAGDW